MISNQGFLRRNPHNQFLFGLLFFIGIAYVGASFIESLSDQMFQSVDCNLVIETPEKYLPEDGTLDEKLERCATWNEVADNQQQFGKFIGYMLFIVPIGYAVTIVKPFGLMKILKNDFEDDDV